MVKLFFGGRLSAFTDLHAGVALAMAGFLGALALLVRQWRSFGWPRRVSNDIPHDVKTALIWILPFAVFLIFWLPRNTFYRLFYLPPLLLLAGALSTMFERRKQSWLLASLVLAVAASNFSFYILPNMYTDSNLPLQFAVELNPVWDERTVVFYESFITDNWTLSYFNPRTRWMRLPQVQTAALAKTMRERAGPTAEIWIETTSYDKLRSATPEWLSSVSMTPRETATRNQRVLVTQLAIE
jgi:hypothetical protein